MPNLQDLLTTDLQQDALQLATKIHADEFKRLNFDMSVVSPDSVPLVKLAYERAKMFRGTKCPHCWVKHEKEHFLVNEFISDNADAYTCKNCNYEHYFTKPII